MKTGKTTTEKISEASVPPRALRAIPALLLVLVLAVFSTVITAEFVWDDQPFIVDNGLFNPPTLHTIGFYIVHPFWNLYQPLTCLAWATLAKLGYLPAVDETGSHLNPYVFHVGAILLHGLAVIAAYRLLRLLVAKPYPAAFGAALYAVHPIQVEAVAFVGVLNNALYTALALFALADYLRASSADQSIRHPRLLWWRGTLLFVLAMLAKPAAVMIPAIAMVLDRVHNRKTIGAVICSAVPWITLAIPCMVWTKLNQPAVISSSGVSPLLRPLVAMDTIGEQLFHAIIPVSLTIDYGRTPSYLTSHPAALLMGVVPIVLMAAIWRFRRSAPLVSAALAIFIIALLPNSGLVSFDFQQYSTVADRYAYFSMFGAALLFAWVLAKVNVHKAVPVAAGFLVVCAVFTEIQLQTWRDSESLFRHAIAVNPDSWMSRINLALALGDRSPEEAMQLCRSAIELNPRSAVAQNNLVTFLIRRAPVEAVQHARSAVALDPTYAEAYCNLGSALMMSGDQLAALSAFAEAYRLQPQNDGFIAPYAQELVTLGRYSEAADLYRALQARHPDSPIARAGLDRISRRQLNAATQQAIGNGKAP